MKQINKNNYKLFLKHYNNFYHCYIKQIKNDSKNSEITIIFDILKNKDYQKTKPAKLKMTFKGINKFSENKPYMIEDIDFTYMDFYHQNEKQLICFSLNNEDPDIEPYLYIVCENLEYEEIK